MSVENLRYKLRYEESSEACVLTKVHKNCSPLRVISWLYWWYLSNFYFIDPKRLLFWLISRAAVFAKLNLKSFSECKRVWQCWTLGVTKESPAFPDSRRRHPALLDSLTVWKVLALIALPDSYNPVEMFGPRNTIFLALGTLYRSSGWPSHFLTFSQLSMLLAA